MFLRGFLVGTKKKREAAVSGKRVHARANARETTKDEPHSGAEKVMVFFVVVVFSPPF